MGLREPILNMNLLRQIAIFCFPDLLAPYSHTFHLLTLEGNVRTCFMKPDRILSKMHEKRSEPSLVFGIEYPAQLQRVETLPSSPSQAQRSLS